MEKQEHRVTVLIGLPTAICEANERHLFKAFATLFIIKSLYKDVPYHDTMQARRELAALAIRSEKTISRHIDELCSNGLMLIKDGKYWPVSWSKLRRRYKIEHAKYYSIPLLKYVQLEYTLKGKVFTEKEYQCSLGFKSKMNANKAFKEIVEEVSTTEPVDVAMHQMGCFMSEGHGYTDDQQYCFNTQFTLKETEIMRGDMSVNYMTIHRMFNYHSFGGPAKLKKSLEKMGVITKRPRVVDLPRLSHKTERSRLTRLGFVMWNVKARKLQLIMPDEIIVTDYLSADKLYLQRNPKAKASTPAGNCSEKSMQNQGGGVC